LSVRWSDAAFQQLTATYSYLAERNPQAADRLLDALFDAAASLREFPFRGRVGPLPHSRELVVKNHIIVYEVLEDGTVHILQVWHGAQDRRLR
jgi:plasmid stabilization system protein ParE